MDKEIISKLDCSVRLKDFFNRYLSELSETEPEKYSKMVEELSETTKPLNIETQEELDSMLNKIHHEVIENKGLWDVSDTSKIANSIGIDFDNSWFNKYSFNYVMNMVRADNYESIEKFCNEYPPTKQYLLDNPKFYAYLAKAWLMDEDAPKAKLVLYLDHIVNY